MNWPRLRVKRAIPPAQPPAVPARRKMGFGQRVVIAMLLMLLVVPPMAGYYSYFSGVPLHLLASTKEDQEESPGSPASRAVSLVSGTAHTLEVPEEVCTTLGIRKGDRDSVADRAAAEHDAAARAARLDPLRSRTARPHPRSIRSGPSGRARPESRIAHPRPDTRSSASCGRATSSPRAISWGFSTVWTWDPRRTISSMPWCNWSWTRRFSTRPRNTPKLFRRSSCSLTTRRAGRPQRHQTGPQQPQVVGHSPGRDRRSSRRSREDQRRQERVAEDPGGPVGEGRETSQGGKVLPHKDTENPWGRVTLRADLDGVVIERNVRQGRDGGRQHGQPVSNRRREPAAGHRQLPRGCTADLGGPRPRTNGSGPCTRLAPQQPRDCAARSTRSAT